MLYLIKDSAIDVLGHSKTIVIKICSQENEVLDFLSKPENLKNFKGDIKIEKVVL